MPKKMKGENPKAVAARERKEAVKTAAAAQHQKEIEDAQWRDDDKAAARKGKRKEDKERKRNEQLQKKRENEELYEQDMQSAKPSKPTTATTNKVTRNMIEQERQKKKAAAAKKKQEEEDEEDIEENVNRLQIEDGARTVDEAISLVTGKEEKLDRHPEKRLKALYNTYESENLPRLRAENPSLRLTQVKQMLWKEWQKSPENPLNQQEL